MPCLTDESGVCLAFPSARLEANASSCTRNQLLSSLPAGPFTETTACKVLVFSVYNTTVLVCFLTPILPCASWVLAWLLRSVNLNQVPYKDLAGKQSDSESLDQFLYGTWFNFTIAILKQWQRFLNCSVSVTRLSNLDCCPTKKQNSKFKMNLDLRWSALW